MDSNSFNDVLGDEELRKRLSKLLVQDCFRNTELENLHAGTFPSSESGDYSDVKVISPYGEIPWKRLSRLSDMEMKALMIDFVNHSHKFVSKLFGPDGADIIERKWGQPPFNAMIAGCPASSAPTLAIMSIMF